MDGFLRPGDVIGGYTVDSCIGLGGSAEVYLVHKNPDEPPYAMKILSPEKAKQDPSLKERFLREAKISIKFCHKNMVQVYETALDPVSGLQYIIMEYLDQKSLHERISGKPIPEEEAIHYAINVAQALVYTENHKLVHRDLKPANILLDSDGRVKLADMGIAHLIDNVSFGTITMETSVVGTPSYSSPEQCRSSHDVDCRADIYSLGACIYEMLTGHAPFTGENPFAVIEKVQKESPVPPIDLNPNISPMINELILRMLQKDPGDRPQSAKEVIKKLRCIIKKYFPQKKQELPSKNRFRYPIIFITMLFVSFIIYASVGHYQEKKSKYIQPRTLTPESLEERVFDLPEAEPEVKPEEEKSVTEEKTSPVSKVPAVVPLVEKTEKTLPERILPEAEVLDAVKRNDPLALERLKGKGFEIKEMEERYPVAWKQLKQQYDSLFIEVKNARGPFSGSLRGKLMFFNALQMQTRLPSRSFSEEELLPFFYRTGSNGPYRELIRSIFRNNPNLYEPVLRRFLTTADRPCPAASLQLLDPDIAKKKFISYNPMDIVIPEELFRYMQKLKMTPSGKYTAEQLTLYRDIYNRKFEYGGPMGRKIFPSRFGNSSRSNYLNLPMPDGKLPLYAALKISQQSAESLIKLNANTNVVDPSGLPIAALFIDDMKSLKFLLDHKADPLMKFNWKKQNINLLEYAIMQKNTMAERLIRQYLSVEHDVFPRHPRKIRYVNLRYPVIIDLKFSSPWEMRGGCFTPDLISNGSLNLPGKHPYDLTLPQPLRGYMCQVAIPPICDLHRGLSIRLRYKVKKADAPFILLAGGRKNQWFRIVMYPGKMYFSIFLGEMVIHVPQDISVPGDLEKLDVFINFAGRFMRVDYQDKTTTFNLSGESEVPSFTGPDKVFTFCDYAQKTPPALISYDEFIVSNTALEREKINPVRDFQSQKMMIQYSELCNKNKEFTSRVTANPSSLTEKAQSIRRLKKRIALLNDLLSRYDKIEKSQIYQQVKKHRDLEQMVLQKLNEL